LQNSLSLSLSLSLSFCMHVAQIDTTDKTIVRRKSRNVKNQQ
jgi:hypothetical protein